MRDNGRKLTAAYRALGVEPGVSRMYSNILIATDGSELADKAVHHGLELAKALGAKVTVTTVTDMIPTGPYHSMPWPSDVERYEAKAARSAKALLDRVAEAAAAIGVPYEMAHVADELPAEGILRACADHGCDLIVMATHGRSGVQRLLLGSQANKVVSLSKVPVLVCR